MITKRSDYRFVIPPLGMAIDGGIMPARDVAGNGSWKDLRGEDACFLLEAACRVSRYKSYGKRCGDVIDNVHVGFPIDNSAMHIAALGFHDASSVGTGQYVCPKMPMVKSEFVECTTNAFPGFANDALEPVGESASACISSVDGLFGQLFDGGLSSDVLRSLWYDYRKIGCVISTGEFCYLLSSGATRRSVTYRIDSDVGSESYGKAVVTWDVTSAFANEFRVAPIYAASSKYVESTWGGYEYDYSWSLASINPVSASATGNTYNEATSSPIAFASGNDALILLGIETVHNSSVYYDCVPCFGRIDSNGILHIRSLDGGSVTSTWIKEHVYDAHDLPSMSEMLETRSDTLSIDIGDFSVILFYDPDIDTSSINWNWTPHSA